MRKFAVNAGWMLVEKIFRVFSVFLFSALIARQLGPEAFGQLNLYMTLAGAVWVLASLGLDALMLRDFARGEVNSNRLLSTVYTLRACVLVASAVAMIAYALLAPQSFPSKEARYGFIVIAMSLPFYNVNSYYPFYQANSRSQFVTLVSIVALMVSALLKVSFLVWGGSFFWLSCAIATDIVVLHVAFTIMQKRSLAKVSLRDFDAKLAGRLLREGAPLAVSAVLVVIYTRIDQVFLDRLAGARELGLYGAATRVSEAFVFLPTLVSTSFFPMIAADLSRKNVQSYFDVVTAFAAFGAAALAAASWWFVPWIFGEEYRGAVLVSVVLLAATFFAVSGGATTNYFVAKGMPYVRLVRSIIGIAVNIALNFALVPRHGALGAAVSALLSQIVAGWLSNMLTSSTRECFMLQSRSILTLGLIGGSRAMRELISRRTP